MKKSLVNKAVIYDINLNKSFIFEKYLSEKCLTKQQYKINDWNAKIFE